jgi:hypothetical protein
VTRSKILAAGKTESYATLRDARRERPRGCRAAEQRDEVAPFHDVTKIVGYILSRMTRFPLVLFSLRPIIFW